MDQKYDEWLLLTWYFEIQKSDTLTQITLVNAEINANIDWSGFKNLTHLKLEKVFYKCPFNFGPEDRVFYPI